jgi:hypothetical protein
LFFESVGAGEFFAISIRLLLRIILTLLVVILIVEFEEAPKDRLEILGEGSLAKTLLLLQFKVAEEVLSSKFLLQVLMMRYLHMVCSMYN